jgi:hypothetical protein
MTRHSQARNTSDVLAIVASTSLARPKVRIIRNSPFFGRRAKLQQSSFMGSVVYVLGSVVTSSRRATDGAHLLASYDAAGRVFDVKIG